VRLADSRDRLLRIGECVIDIRGETRPCERMDEALPGLRDAMKPDWNGGVFGTIVVGGVIRVGDPVSFDGWADDATRAPVLKPRQQAILVGHKREGGARSADAARFRYRSLPLCQLGLLRP